VIQRAKAKRGHAEGKEKAPRAFASIHPSITPRSNPRRCASGDTPRGGGPRPQHLPARYAHTHATTPPRTEPTGSGRRRLVVRPRGSQAGRCTCVRMYPCGVHTTTGTARVGVGAACACTSSQGSPSPCAVVDRALDPRGNQRVLWPGRTSATARTSSLSATARRRRPRQQPDDGAPGRYSSRASTLSRTAARGTGGASAVKPCGVACPRRPLALGGDGRVSGTDVPEPAA
jgi:hypothetical protein